MQTCKDLDLMVMPKISYDELLADPSLQFKPERVKIPSGTYVKRIGPKRYMVKAWRGMPKEYKEFIEDGVIISYNLVKGKFN